MRVLIIDDSIVMRAIIRRVLEKAGVEEILEAADGGEAIRFVSQQPNLILVDLMMPKVDGPQFIDVVRKAQTDINIPIIVVTSCERAVLEEKGIAGSVDGYLQKPFTDDQLLAVLKDKSGAVGI